MLDKVIKKQSGQFWYKNVEWIHLTEFIRTTRGLHSVLKDLLFVFVSGLSSGKFRCYFGVASAKCQSANGSRLFQILFEIGICQRRRLKQAKIGCLSHRRYPKHLCSITASLLVCCLSQWYRTTIVLFCLFATPLWVRNVVNRSLSNIIIIFLMFEVTMLPFSNLNSYIYLFGAISQINLFRIFWSLARNQSEFYTTSQHILPSSLYYDLSTFSCAIAHLTDSNADSKSLRGIASPVRKCKRFFFCNHCIKHLLEWRLSESYLNSVSDVKTNKYNRPNLGQFWPFTTSTIQLPFAIFLEMTPMKKWDFIKDTFGSAVVKC